MTTEELDIGNTVICDDCGGDYTHSTAKGGILVDRKGICPTCTPEWLRLLASYHEEDHIRARANEGEEFRAFILRIRGGNNTVRISGSPEAVKEMTAIVKGANKIK